MTDRFRFALALLLAVDLLHRWLSLAAGPSPLQLDARVYWLYGRHIVEGDWLLRVEPNALFTPGYPFYLALCQLLFGSGALEAAIIGQHLMGVATSLAIASTCRLLTGSRLALLAGYAVSMACLARLQYANFILSETLFILVIALHILFLVRWQQEARPGAAIAAGLLVGLATLVRPVAQALWLAEVLALAALTAIGRRKVVERRDLPQAMLFVAAAATVVAPWMLHNYALHGEAFVTKGTGRNLWVACFSENGAALPLPPSLDGSAGSQHPESGVRNEWSAYKILRDRGLSEPAADDWMRDACVNAILQSPARYASSVAINFLDFWVNIEQAFPWYVGYREDGAGQYFDQTVWHSPAMTGPFNDFLKFAYRYSRVLAALGSVAGLIGATMLMRLPDTRRSGAMLLALLLYFAVVTALIEQPLYRYRTIVEPALIIAAVAALWQRPFALRRNGRALRVRDAAQ